MTTQHSNTELGLCTESSVSVKELNIDSTSDITSDESSNVQLSPSTALLFPISSTNPQYRAALKSVEAADMKKEQTGRHLEEAKLRLKQAQEVYDFALKENSKAITAIVKADRELKELDLLLPGQWNSMYNKLVQYKNKYGHCEVSQDGCFGKVLKTNQKRKKPVIEEDDRDHPDFQKLARWVGNQRVFYKYFQNGDTKHIKKHRIEALNRLGFIWDVKEHRWLQKYNILKAYKERHGNCEISSKENKDLHDWALRLRREYSRMKDGIPYSLSDERIRLLEEIQFNFQSAKSANSGKRAKCITPEGLWTTKQLELEAFYKEYGHTQVNLRSMSKNHSLTRWVAYLRAQYILLQEGKPSILTPDRITSLEALDFQWKKPSSLPRKNCGKKKRKVEEFDSEIRKISTNKDQFRRNER